MKILLLEDDPTLCETLNIFLSKEGYQVDFALSIKEAEELSFNNNYDLYLFDINLPKGSGLELLEYLRDAEDNTPTIFITACDDMDSIQKGFSLDAIDYIKKPFDPKELKIRIDAKFKNSIIEYLDISYDPKKDLLYKDGKLIDLGYVNHKIFTLLLKNCGSLVSKEELYNCFDKSSSTALRVAITTIKQRLNVDIKNIRAKGYILEKL